MTTNDSGTIPDAEPLAAAADLAAAMRGLIETAVTSTVPAAEVRAAAELVREVTERLSVARRPVSQLPALDDVTTGRRVFNPVDDSVYGEAPACFATETIWQATDSAGNTAYGSPVYSRNVCFRS